MNPITLLNSGLVVHLVGITTMVGATLSNFIAYRQLWKFLPNEKANASLVIKATSQFPLLQLIGGGMILTGGITMMIALHGILMAQLWFKVKMGFLALIILNAIVNARPAGKKLRRVLAGDVQAGISEHAAVRSIKSRIFMFYTLQLLLFLGIFILSIFRFN